MAKFCRNCGNEVGENAVICIKCGCGIAGASAGVARQSTAKKPTSISLFLGIACIVLNSLGEIMGLVSINLWVLSLFFIAAASVVAVFGIVSWVKEYKETGKTLGLMLNLISVIVIPAFFNLISALIWNV